MTRISAVTRSGTPISPAKLAEREVTRQVKDFMLYRGWRAVRMQRTVIAGAFQSGEPGIPDYLFLRYVSQAKAHVLAIWIEFKGPTGRVSEQQQIWHCDERLKGALVWVVDDFEWFAAEYDRLFGWLHSGERAPGQLDMLVGM